MRTSENKIYYDGLVKVFYKESQTIDGDEETFEMVEKTKKITMIVLQFEDLEIDITSKITKKEQQEIINRIE